MANGSAIEKLYDLQLLGGKEAYATLNGINTLFKEIAANKVSLNSVFNINVDAAKLDTLNKAFTQLIVSNKDLILHIRTLITEVSKFGQIGQQMTNSVATNMAKTNMATVQNIVGFQKLQQSVSANALTAETYHAVLTALQERMRELKIAIEDNASASVTIRKEFNQGKITQEEYDAAINQIIMSQHELKAALAATGKEIATLTDLWNVSAVSAAENSQQVAANKVSLSEYNIQLKQQAKLMMAAEGSIDEYSIKLGQLRDKYRQLSQAERESASGRAMLIQIQQLDTEVKLLDKSIGNSQRNVGNYGSAFDSVGGKLKNFIVRDLFRATAGFIVFNMVFEGIQKLFELIPQKVDKSTQAMQQFNDVLTKQIDEFIELQRAQNDYFLAGADAYKIYVDVIKAKGVVNGEVFKAQKEQFDAEQQMRQKQLSDLYAVSNMYGKVRDIFINYDKYGDLNNVFKQLEGLGLSANDLKAWKIQINEYLEARSKLSAKEQKNYKLSDNTDIFKKQAAVQKDTYNKEAEIENAKTEFLARQLELRYNKNIELTDQLIQVREQKREVEQEEEINSADKITKDIAARYKIMYDDIHKKMRELAKQFPDDKLPEELQSKYGAILANIRKTEAAEKNNRLNAFNKSEFFSTMEEAAAEAKGASDVTRYFAESGHAAYGTIVEAADKDRDAKIKAENANYEALREQYYQHSRNTEEIDRNHNEKLRQIDEEAYKARLAAATQYFNSIRDKINASNALEIEKLQTAHLNKMVSILSGGSSKANKDYYTNRENQLAIIAEAQKTIEAQQQLLKGVKDVVNKSQNAADNAQTPAEKDIAGRQLISDQKTVADIENSIAQANKDIAEAQNNLKEADNKWIGALKQQAVSAFDEISHAYIQMLEQREQAREREMQSEMDWNKKQMDNQAQSNAQRQANEKAYAIAQQQMERDRFNQQKKLAEEQMAIDYATAVMKIVSSNASLGPAAPAVDAVEIGALSAIYFAKLAFLNEQQYAQGGEVPNGGGEFGGRAHSQGGTPFFFMGRNFEAEAGELAIINKRSAASNQVLTVTGTPKQIASGVNAWGGGVNFSPGAIMHKYEYGGLLGSQIEPPSFVNDYYTAKAEGNNQLSMLYNMVMENNKALREHTAAINSRIDKLQVHVNPHDVTKYQKSYTKNVNVGKL